MRSLWRLLCSSLAESGRLQAWAQAKGFGSALARRYTGGPDAETAAALARRLRDEAGLASSLYRLGEYVRSAADVELNVQAKLEAAAALGRLGLDVHVSVDPTQIGLLQGSRVLASHLRRIGHAVLEAAGARPGRHAVMLDMEDPGVTDATLAAYAELRSAGLPAAITLQAYRHRTAADLGPLVAAGAMVRLVKGAFPARPDQALQRRAEISAAFLAHASTLLSPAARAAGVYPVIATHDPALQQAAIGLAERNGWSREQYEFEMLLGARDPLARQLAAAGQRVRLYVPFGSDWWPYAMRRIGENPASALLIARGWIDRD